MGQNVPLKKRPHDFLEPTKCCQGLPDLLLSASDLLVGTPDLLLRALDPLPGVPDLFQGPLICIRGSHLLPGLLTDFRTLTYFKPPDLPLRSPDPL